MTRIVPVGPKKSSEGKEESKEGLRKAMKAAGLALKKSILKNQLIKSIDFFF